MLDLPRLRRPLVQRAHRPIHRRRPLPPLDPPFHSQRPPVDAFPQTDVPSSGRKKIIASEFFALARRIWRRLVVTYLWVCGAICGCFGLFLVILIAVCNSLAILGYPPDIVVYPALLVMLGFSMVYAHTIIVCNLAGVISVLEDVSGPRAILRSVSLVKGQTQAGLLIFLGSTIGMAFVEGLFEHRVKTLSYGDGSSRIWEGPLLVVMYSFVVLVDSMMSAVFYFTCRSSCMEMLNGSEHSLEEIENFSFESRSIE
ncbi:uncharacterized protein A4U43_C08F13590 [Asparagus officinalis]|nr:uncharacterized protein A4U43_C08F13590 [Asparagus officinalis]